MMPSSIVGDPLFKTGSCPLREARLQASRMTPIKKSVFSAVIDLYS
jgi:hypothetical protein